MLLFNAKKFEPDAAPEAEHLYRFFFLSIVNSDFLYPEKCLYRAEDQALEVISIPKNSNISRWSFVGLM